MDTAGHNSLHLRVKHLAPGRYQLVATPRLGRLQGAAVRVQLQIVR
jgi:hypothetical protein